MTTILKATPVKGLDDKKAINYDSDDFILRNTLVEEGKWRFYEGEKLIAEAVAPGGKPTSELMDQWCKGVRAKTKRVLTIDDETKKEEGRKNRKVSTQILGPDGQALDGAPPVLTAGSGIAGVDTASGSSSESVRILSADDFLTNNIAHVKDQLKSLSLAISDAEAKYEDMLRQEKDLMAEQYKWEQLAAALAPSEVEEDE